jgi:hypothetical protein
MPTNQLPTIHVEPYDPDHEPMTYADTHGEPILEYRAWSTTGARVRDFQTNRWGRLLDGWVLHYEASWCDDRREPGEPPGRLGDNPDEYITGIELEAVDEAVAAAQKHLISLGYREAVAAPRRGDRNTKRTAIVKSAEGLRDEYLEKALRLDVRSLHRRYGTLDSYVPVLEQELKEAKREQVES